MQASEFEILGSESKRKKVPFSQDHIIVKMFAPFQNSFYIIFS